MKLVKGNHKLNDLFHLENEEMAGVDDPVSYNKLHNFHVERTSINKSQKMFSYPTLIQPPCLNGVEGKRVYITEINVDLSTDFLSPHTIQDPTYMCYDKDVLRVKLNEPLLVLCRVEGSVGELEVLHFLCL